MNGVLTSCGVTNRSNLSLYLGNKGHSNSQISHRLHMQKITHMWDQLQSVTVPLLPSSTLP